jgi:hypothetical protein
MGALEIVAAAWGAVLVLVLLAGQVRGVRHERARLARLRAVRDRIDYEQAQLEEWQPERPPWRPENSHGRKR